jgi:hypothetical protein
MKTTYYIAALTLLLVAASCQKVVTIDLNSAKKLPVIQANITNDPGPYTVKLNNTANYYDPNVFTAITGAVVSFSDDAGNSEVLKETSPGIYKSSSFVGVPGRTYRLVVLTGGIEYNAVSSMPQPVPIDSVAFEDTADHDGIRVLCYFKDPPAPGNYYRLRLHSNDTTAVNQNSVRIASDNLTNGQEMRLSFRSGLMIQDTVTVMLESIDKITYDFYNTLENAQGGDNQFLSALPANPTNNISDGALGYFSAYSISKKTIIIKP